MDKVLERAALVYIDDVLVFGGRLSRLEEMLHHLLAASLKVRKK